MEFLKTRWLFREGHSVAHGFVCSFEYPWQALPCIKEFILELGKGLSKEEFLESEKGVWISKGARVDKTVRIEPPCIIEEGAQIRHCAYIRGSVIVGKGAVVGNSTELKNCILLDKVQVPHYNYVGDSILGYGAHMGAGAITSNVKGDRGEVYILGKLPTGQRKVGAFLGDGAEIGCGAVLNPGTVVGCGSRVYPLVSLRGYLPPRSIYKSNGDVTKIVN